MFSEQGDKCYQKKHIKHGQNMINAHCMLSWIMPSQQELTEAVMTIKFSNSMRIITNEMQMQK